MEMLRKEKVNWSTFHFYLFPSCNKSKKRDNFPIFMSISSKKQNTCSTNSFSLLVRSFDPQQHCTSILETISHHINSEFDELSAHRLLSIFKMAEVQIIWPEVNGARSVKHNIGFVILLTVLPTLLINCRWSSYPTSPT